MQIKRIRLKNFRQFYGDQEIILARKGSKNVTLIHAENGVGKTTLLNSVLWTFFGETTKKFEQKDRILNFEAEREGERSASVEITFKHEKTDYLATRTHTVTPGGQNRIRFTVVSISKNGAFGEPLPNADAFINTVIPYAMAPYFFFDGEQAETFSSETNNKEIAAAIRNILGSTLIENAIGDLRYVAKKFNEEIGDASGDSEIAALEKRISELEAAKEQRCQKILLFEKEATAVTEQLNAVTKSLLDAKEAAHYQQAREDKKYQLKTTDSQLKEVRTDILKWIATKGVAAVSERLTSQSLDFIDEESLKGRIPSPYNEGFVRGLLEARKCVCERSIDPASTEWNAISSLLSNAANAEVLSRVVRVRARIAVLKDMREDAPKLLKDAEEKLARLIGQEKNLEKEIEELNLKILELPVAEIQARERARIELGKKNDDIKTSRIRTIRDNEHADDEIDRLNRQVAELAVRNVAVQRLVLRRDISNRAADFLQAFLGTSEQKAKEQTELAVNRVLENTTRRHYRFEVDETFQIRLLFEDGTPTPKSGGENQMMSLAFLAALVEYAEKRSEQDDDGLFVPATVAPLILDSPFGQLDDAYRAATAEFLPNMAPQVVLLVSSSQGKKEVMEALQHRIGAEFVLVAHNSSPKGDKKQDFLTVGGRKTATTLFGREKNMTEIFKVSE